MTVAGRIIARETISAPRNGMIVIPYGGNSTRQSGRVGVLPETLISAMKTDA